MNDAEKELLRLTTDLPEWVMRGDPSPWDEDAKMCGCVCFTSETPLGFTLCSDCPLHGDFVLSQHGARAVRGLCTYQLPPKVQSRIAQFQYAQREHYDE